MVWEWVFIACIHLCATIVCYRDKCNSVNFGIGLGILEWE